MFSAVEIVVSIVSLAVACFATGFSFGYYAGKNQNPTITEQPDTLCPDVKEYIPDSKDWEQTLLVFYNGKVKTVICDWIYKKQCKLINHKCRFFCR